MMKQKKSKTKKTGLQTPKLRSFVPMPPIKPAKEDAHPRYIDAEPIEKFITDGLNSQEKPYGWVGVKILAEVHYAPTADVAPVVHAHWERKAYFPDGTPAWVCSRCGHPEEVKYSHCNCGARMDEEVKEDDD